MPSMVIKDGSGASVYIEIDGGAGTLGDPFRVKNYVSLLNSSVPVTDNGGSLTVDGTVNTQGMVAHDAADSGNPHKMGARAEASVKTATMVSDADRTDVVSDLDGLIMFKPFCPFGDIVLERVSDTTGNSTAFANFGAGGAGIRNYVTTIVAYNSSTTNVFVDLRDGTAGSVIFTFPVPAASGVVINLPIPIRQPTANTALAYDGSAAASTVYISVIGFQSKL